MASVNKVILLGNVGRDPEIRYAPSGDAVANISIATSEVWKDKAGEKQEATEWHRCVAFGKSAETIGEYVKKGSQIYVEGRLKTKKWQDKEGVDRYTTEITVDRFQMLGKRDRTDDEDKQPGDGKPSDGAREHAAAGGGSAKRTPPPKSGGSFDDLEDDIPF